MSTIAQPRDSSVSRRLPNVGTPTSSTRPSLDLVRSSESSPGPVSGIGGINISSTASLPGATAQSLNSKRARAALREYYNLRKPLPAHVTANSAPSAAASDVASETSSNQESSFFSSVADSDIDRPDFEPEKYVSHTLETQSLDGLLRTYHGVLTDMRALDAERKALVYDNYSKLIAATEMIGRLREGVVTRTEAAGQAGLGLYMPSKAAESQITSESGQRWDHSVNEVMTRVEVLQTQLRGDANKRLTQERRRMEKGTVLGILRRPDEVTILVKNGRIVEAREIWLPALKILQTWKSRGVGGADVQRCIEAGEAALDGAAFTAPS